MKFTNIHTHQNLFEDDVTTIINLFPDKEPLTGFPGSNFFSIGLHPWYIRPESFLQDIGKVEKLAVMPQCLAIGETGLDRNITVPLDLQKDVFRTHLEIANEVSKPVIIHCVRAFQEILQVQKPFTGKMKLIFHGFNNSRQIANDLLNKGHYLSFGKALLNPVSNASKMFPEIPNDRFFLETDDSEIPISTIYLKAAALKNFLMDEMKELVLKNVENCFGKKL